VRRRLPHRLCQWRSAKHRKSGAAENNTRATQFRRASRRNGHKSRRSRHAAAGATWTARTEQADAWNSQDARRVAVSHTRTTPSSSAAAKRTPWPAVLVVMHVRSFSFPVPGGCCTAGAQAAQHTSAEGQRVHNCVVTCFRPSNLTFQHLYPAPHAHTPTCPLDASVLTHLSGRRMGLASYAPRPSWGKNLQFR
jgi:hypothetical protein